MLRRLVEAKDGVEVLEGSVCTYHVHMCLRIAPKHSVSKVMGYLKGKSALILFDHHPDWRSRTGKDRTFWARGYYVSTVGLNKAVIMVGILTDAMADEVAVVRRLRGR